jgi:uncharacterized damage-inducible protein DinB
VTTDISDSLVAKIDEQIERTLHLTGMVPASQLQAQPISGAWNIGELLGHLLDCLAGFCAVLAAAYPERLAHFAELRSLPVNQSIEPDEARVRIAQYRAYLSEGFALLDDAELARKLSTLFVPEGETLATLLLGNLEHLINHKRELFLYLKLIGVKVSSEDLYRFRGF